MENWIVDGYFDTGKRETTVLDTQLIKYHHTIEDYFSGLRQAGFQVDALRESRPRPELFSDPATFRRRMRIPLMLFFSTVRPESSSDEI